MKNWAEIRSWAKGYQRYGKYLLCIGGGILLFLVAEMADGLNEDVENGVLFRNSCGKGDTVYEFYVDGLEAGDGAESAEFVDRGEWMEQESQKLMRIQVPERKLSETEFAECLPEMIEQLCTEMLDGNVSLQEVRSDLNLVKELPDYGVTVEWMSEQPEIVNDRGVVAGGGLAEEEGIRVYLHAVISNGLCDEMVEIPVVVYPPVESRRERFERELESLVCLNQELEKVVLPDEFEGRKLTYRRIGHLQNLVLVFLGIVAAVCLALKEKTDERDAIKCREDHLMADYPDLISEFLILTGAGYPAKAAWKKIAEDFSKSENQGFHPLYQEMQIAVNQIETGTPETRAYAAFGRRCGLRCYIRFASLLEGNVSTGGVKLRALLEAEMDDAFRLRTTMARRKGEEASSKLLLPMFGMLGVVMVMVVSPAFLTLGS